MSQHFLLSAQARNLSLTKIVKMSDMEAFDLMKSIRWSDTNGEPVCPCCGSVKKPFFLKTRMQFRCRECFHTFSVTSGTVFAGHKLSLQTYLLAIALFTNAAKSISALQLSRDLDVQYKTAWVLTHKIRESLMEYNLQDKFEGTVEMDGQEIFKSPNYLKLADRILVQNQVLCLPQTRAFMSSRMFLKSIDNKLSELK